MTTALRTEIDVRTAYIDLCDAVKALAQSVVAAESVRYEAPPGMSSSRGEDTEVSNPTLDTVLDIRRYALSEEARVLAGYMTTTAHSLRARTARLEAAVTRWEGGPSDGR